MGISCLPVSASPDQVLSMIYFARVVEAGSFTAAAAKLGVSKSVVSERISAFEEHYRVRLLHRTTRKLALTAEGLAVYQHCTRVLLAAEAAAELLDQTSAAPSGVLRLEAPVVFAEEYLTEPIATYLAEFPDVRVELSLNDRKVDLVAAGIDVAVRITGELKDSSLVVRKLASDHTVICAAPSYLERAGTPQTAEDVLRHDCILYSVLKVADEWRFHSADKRSVYSLPLTGRFSAEGGSMLRRAALRGMGLCVMPRFMIAKDVAEGRLRVVLEDVFAGSALNIYAVYPPARRASVKVRAFVELLGAHFKRARWGG